MLPQFEEPALSNASNFALGAEGPSPGNPVGGICANSTVGGTTLGLFRCPINSPVWIAPNSINAGEVRAADSY